MKYKAFFIITLLLLLSACSKPIEESRKDYVGHWQSQEMVLTIFQNGRVSYKRVNGNVSTSVSGPLKEFIDDSFVVGIAFFTTTFEVSEAPHRVESQWQMVVDGVRLVRQDR